MLISYGADPTLTTYAGVSPLELAEPHSSVHTLLDQHINDVQGATDRPWEFPGSGSWSEDIHELGWDATADPPELGENQNGGPVKNLELIGIGGSDSENDKDGFEFEASEAPLPPLYKLKVGLKALKF